MKLIAIALAVAAFLAATDAACPNSCSGHGQCSTDDQCSCWSGFSGYDCSSRDCPVEEGWWIDESNPHAYAECANRGICNRDSGVCDCFDGFVGRACQRSVCPNECSGQGKCRLIADLPNYSPKFALDWDTKAITGCVCDPGFMGPDCSQRICLHGDDPMTECASDAKYETQEMSVTMLVEDELRTSTRMYRITIPTAGNAVVEFEVTQIGASDVVTVTMDTPAGSSDTQDNMKAALEDLSTGLPAFRDNPSEFSVNCGTQGSPNRLSCTIELSEDFIANITAAEINVARQVVFDEFITITPINVVAGTVSWFAVGPLAARTVEFVDGDFSVVLDTFANETLFSQGAHDIFGNDEAAQNLQNKMQALPLSRGRGMTVEEVGDGEWANNRISRKYKFTFGGNAVGPQRALQCAYSQDVNGELTFGCPFEGCQPLVRQPHLQQRTGVCNEEAYGTVEMGKKLMEFFTVQPGALLGCPVGIKCQNPIENDWNTFHAGVDIVIFREEDELFSVHAKGIGEGDVHLLYTGDWGPYFDIQDVLADDELVFLGRIRDSIQGQEIDLGRIVPTLKINIATNEMMADLENCEWGNVRRPFTLSFRYTIASCSSGIKIGPGTDVNVEFIECSGRGQCDRGNGLCQCFDGYHGAACDEQNVLV